MDKYDDKAEVRCSFCGKTQTHVDRLMAGDNAYICDECVRLCMSILDESAGVLGSRRRSSTIYSSIPTTNIPVFYFKSISTAATASRSITAKKNHNYHHLFLFLFILN